LEINDNVYGQVKQTEEQEQAGDGLSKVYELQNNISIEFSGVK
jgi:hypothetical protein